MTTALALPGLDIAVTPVGTTAPVSPDTALDGLAVLAQLTTTSRWTIGDLALDVIDWELDRLPELWRQIADRLPDDRASFMASIAVSHAFRDRTRRYEGLSWSHHRTVTLTHRMDADEADDWLAEAADNGWSVHALEQQIRADRDRTKQGRISGSSTWSEKHRSTLTAVTKALGSGVEAVVLHRDGTWHPLDDTDPQDDDGGGPIDTTARARYYATREHEPF